MYFSERNQKIKVYIGEKRNVLILSRNFRPRCYFCNAFEYSVSVSRKNGPPGCVSNNSEHIMLQSFPI